MNYFIVRDDDDLFVFRKNCFTKMKIKKFFLESIKSARFMCRCAFGMAYFGPESLFAACCCGKHNSERLNSHYVITSLEITEN